MPNPQPQPQLGSQVHYAQGRTSPPDAARISPESCTQLSLFKDLMREYRKIDDGITMRLNRTAAQFRERDRTPAAGPSSASAGPAGPLPDDACAFFWTELVANWKGRLQVVQYCVNVVDSSREAKRSVLALEPKDLALGEDQDARTRRRLQAEVYADEVKRNQIRDEMTVERIIRQRSFDAFRARCKFWTPPRTGAANDEARKWWDDVQQGK
ncbi:hypothetical protein EXIGLDRAFT_608228 [Exidia glandulosa HHB12029]|uniref:Caffeine-induced death protein 2 n=1 Tax=Exidia glandulosa HHB12029 TaxID=1314781 RepID=A0A165L306_EXIGL|nr:hypothetical protein EXIGLDRAFT_608228 [Exidia glandulosa HHB12029]